MYGDVTHVWKVRSARPNRAWTKGSNFFYLVSCCLSDWLDLHSAHDVDGLRFAGVAEVGHAEDGTQQVHIQPQRVKVTLTEQFYMRGQEILGRKDRDVITKGFLQLCSWKRGNHSERKAL